MFDYSLFNRLAVPFEMILDCDATAASVKAELLNTLREVSQMNVSGKYPFSNWVMHLVNCSDLGSYDRAVEVNSATKARNELMAIVERSSR